MPEIGVGVETGKGKKTDMATVKHSACSSFPAVDHCSFGARTVIIFSLTTAGGRSSAHSEWTDR
jgi:hypothetical protein